MQFLEDIEINLKDNDLLNTKTYADCLVQIIRNAPNRFTVGLFGEWGSGKSSIIKTARLEFESEEDKKIKFITYDAWKYANDSFRRTFLLEIAKSLGVSKDKQKSLFNDFYTNQNKDIKIEKQKNYKFMFFFLLMFVVIFVASLFFNLETNNILTIQAFLGLLILSIHFYKNSTDDLKFTMTEPLFFAPEQFEECFNELVDKALNKSTQDKWFHPFTKNYEKLVIVIDNIDRCDKKLSYELLTNIKNFLGDKDNVTFIIPLDNGALKRHLKVNDSSEKEADEFLRKFFNVTLTIKPFKALDLYDYTNDLNIQERLNLNPDSVGIIAEEYASNPRRIIQLLNNLSTELEILKTKVGEEFSVNYQSLIVVLMILREEWASFYKQIFLQPHMLMKLDELKELENDNSLKLFLYRTKAIVNNANIESIEKILYNKENHQNISSEILDLLNNDNLNTLKNNLEDAENYASLMKYLIDRLKKEIDRKTYKTNALNIFYKIIKVNKIHMIERHHNIQINAIFINDLIWINLIDNIDKDNVESFFNYVNITEHQGIKDLSNISYKRFKDFWSKDSEIPEDAPEIWMSYLEIFINYIDSEKILKKLKGQFQRFYEYHFINGDYLYQKEWITKPKLQYVIGDTFIDLLINKLDFDLNSSDFYKELIYLSEQNIITLKHIQKLFAKLSTIQSVENSENLLVHIENLTKLLKNITPESENIPEIITYINSLSNNRNGLNIHNQTTTINLLNDLANDQEKIMIMFNFYLEVYRVTENNTNVVGLCNTLLSKYPTHKVTFYKMLIDLRNKYNFSLKPFSNLLFNETNITDDILELYSQMFINSDMESNQIEVKIKTYIELIVGESDSTSISIFMDKIIDNAKIKELVAKLVLKLELEQIKRLPLKMQALAYDYFDEDIAKVENDIGILKEMLKTPKYVDNIIGVIISKLQYKTKIKDALVLIEAIEKLSDEQKKSLISALEKRKGGEKFDQKVDEQSDRLNSL